MLEDAKVLITGPAGQIAAHFCARLAAHNEVWGIARFSEPGSRERVEAMGVTTRVVDLAAGDLSEVPTDFTHVVHLAAFQLEGFDFDHALAVNAEGTGLLMQHCRSAQAFLVTSTVAIYDNNADLTHRYTETDPLSDSRQPYSPTYAISKIAEEAVARTMARALQLPTTIARVNVAYGDAGRGGLPLMHFEMMAAGQPVPLKDGSPNPFNPIHVDDMVDHLGPLCAAASVPATVLNWGGDDEVTVEEWCTHLGSLAGIEPVFETYPVGIHPRAMDNSRRRELIGGCSTPWRDGMAAMLAAHHPELDLA